MGSTNVLHLALFSTISQVIIYIIRYHYGILCISVIFLGHPTIYKVSSLSNSRYFKLICPGKGIWIPISGTASQCATNWSTLASRKCFIIQKRMWTRNQKFCITQYYLLSSLVFIDWLIFDLKEIIVEFSDSCESLKKRQNINGWKMKCKAILARNKMRGKITVHYFTKLCLCMPPDH